MTPDQANIRTKNALRLRNMRKQRGLTQAQMAERVGLPNAECVLDLESLTAASFNRSHLHKMAKYLDVRLTPIHGWLRVDPDYGYAEGAIHEDELKSRQAHNARAFRKLRAERYGLSPGRLDAYVKEVRFERLPNGDYPFPRVRGISARDIKLCEQTLPHVENTKAVHRLAEFYDVMLRRDKDGGLWVDPSRKYMDGTNIYDYYTLRYHNIQMIKNGRKALGWTQAIVSEHTGISMSTIAKLETSLVQSRESLQQLAPLFDYLILDTHNGPMLVQEKNPEPYLYLDNVKVYTNV